MSTGPGKTQRAILKALQGTDIHGLEMGEVPAPCSATLAPSRSVPASRELFGTWSCAGWSAPTGTAP
jgi:hypothetical protein